jgi:hypothetical protein
MRGAVRPPRTVRFAAVAAAALMAGLLPGTDSDAREGTGTLSLAYTCQFASGTQDVTVGVQQTFPTDAVVGAAIQPGDPEVALTIPRAGLTAMLPSGATALGGTASLGAHITHGGSKALANWPDLKATSVPVAGTGDLDLSFTGEVPALKVTAPGPVVFSAGDLSLTLRPAAGDPQTPPPSDPATPPAGGTDGTGTDGTGAAKTATSADTASTTAPAAPLPDITGTCTPAPGQDAVLGTVPVTGATTGQPPGGPSGSAPPSGSGSAPAPATSGLPPSAGGSPSGTATSTSTDTPGSADRHAGTRNTIEVAPPLHSHVYGCKRTHVPGEIDQSVLPKAPAGTTFYPAAGDPPIPDDPTCTYAVGFTNVLKLKGATVVNDPHGKPGLTTVQTVRSGFRPADPDNTGLYLEIDSRGWMDLPPSDATFLTFGFMPTSARMYLVPTTALTVVAVGYGDTGDSGPASQPTVTTLTGKLTIELRNVKVNGVPLDVGSSCKTVRPMQLRLTGVADAFMPGGGDGKPDYKLDTGGPLSQDDLTIPPFGGCVTAQGEDVSSLFTSSVSGPGNSLNLIQGLLCYPAAQIGCNADPAAPVEIDLPELPHH